MIDKQFIYGILISNRYFFICFWTAKKNVNKSSLDILRRREKIIEGKEKNFQSLG